MSSSSLRRLRASLAALAALAALAPLACGSTTQGAAGSTGGAASALPPYVPPPASTIVDESPVRIRREVFLVPGVVPPKNPVAPAHAETPPELDYVRVVRYRVDADPPKPARAIAVLMPGFLGGAGSFDSLARALVRRSQGDEALEAWAIDRRSNLLEDHHGLDVAEVRKDPDIGMHYYFDQQEVEGKSFAGFLSADQIAFESEWGLETTIGDLRAVITRVAQPDRKARVVLLGHSLGGSIVEEYAAWDFAGTAGYTELAGLVTIDGVSGVEGAAAPGLTADEYVNGQPNPYAPSAGLTAIRAQSPIIALPLLGQDVYPIAAVVAMRATWQPKGFADDPYRDKAFETLLALTTTPKMTNRAAMGLAFDDASNGVSFAAVSCGAVTGGATAKYKSIFGSELDHPSDPSATYDWVEFDRTNPPEHTSVDDIARSWFQGPSLDFADWYFAARLSLDAGAAGTLTMKAGDWPLDKYQLKAVHGASMDLPIFGAVAALVHDVKALDPLKALVANVPIGPGRPLAGKPRTNGDAFKVVDISDFTHIDPLAGTDQGNPKVTAWYDTLAAWMKTNTPSGGVVVPVQAEK